MSLFQPQLTAQPTAAKTVVASNESAISAVNQATDAVVAGVSGYRLNDLRSQFDEIVQARQTGGDRNHLMTRARVALNSFKADSPALGAEADAAFSKAFGTGSVGSGAFSATPVEKGQDQAITKMAEMSTLYGISMRTAQERYALQGAAEQVNAQADVDKYDSEQANKTTELGHQFNLNHNTTRILDTVNKILTEKGSLSAQEIPGFAQTIASEGFRMSEAVRKNAFRDDGSLAITQTELNRRLQDVKNWQTEMNTMVKEFSKSKIDGEILKDMNNEGALSFTAAFPIVSAASAISPQLGSQIFDMVTTPDETRRAWISQNPKVKSLLENQKAYSGNLTSGVAKIVLVDRQGENLNGVEAQTLGATLRNAPDSVSRYLIDEAASSEKASEKFKQVAYWSPEVLDTVLKPGFSNMLKTSTDKYAPVVDSMLAGAITAFQSSYSLMNNALPSSVKIITTTDDSGRKALEINTPHGLGDGLTAAEFKRNVNNMYKVLNNNPQYLQKVGEKIGMPDITPEAYLSMVLSTSETVTPQTAERRIYTANKPAPFVPEAPAGSPKDLAGDVQRFSDLMKEDVGYIKEILDNVDATVLGDKEFGVAFEEIKSLLDKSLSAKSVKEQPVEIPVEGDVVDGYRFLGGNPSEEANWEKVD